MLQAEYLLSIDEYLWILREQLPRAASISKRESHKGKSETSFPKPKRHAKEAYVALTGSTAHGLTFNAKVAVSATVIPSATTKVLQ